jgi:hypothetical protein
MPGSTAAWRYVCNSGSAQRDQRAGWQLGTIRCEPTTHSLGGLFRDAVFAALPRGRGRIARGRGADLRLDGWAWRPPQLRSGGLGSRSSGCCSRRTPPASSSTIQPQRAAQLRHLPHERQRRTRGAGDQPPPARRHPSLIARRSVAGVRQQPRRRRQHRGLHPRPRRQPIRPEPAAPHRPPRAVPRLVDPRPPRACPLSAGARGRSWRAVGGGHKPLPTPGARSLSQSLWKPRAVAPCRCVPGDEHGHPAVAVLHGPGRELGVLTHSTTVLGEPTWRC